MQSSPAQYHVLASKTHIGQSSKGKQSEKRIPDKPQREELNEILYKGFRNAPGSSTRLGCGYMV